MVWSNMYDIYPKGWNVSSRNADTYAISLDGCFLEKNVGIYAIRWKDFPWKNDGIYAMSVWALPLGNDPHCSSSILSS